VSHHQAVAPPVRRNIRLGREFREFAMAFSSDWVTPDQSAPLRQILPDQAIGVLVAAARLLFGRKKKPAKLYNLQVFVFRWFS